MPTKPRKRKPLTRERVLERAIAVADRDGIEAVSMRKLGQTLGVEAMSLYNHVANKGELVGAMVDRVIEQFGAHAVWVKAAKPEPPIALPVTEVSVELWRETE